GNSMKTAEIIKKLNKVADIVCELSSEMVLSQDDSEYLYATWNKIEKVIENVEKEGK
ncbi:unnamed protein product, partial [marine sediment metagenome]